MKNRLIISFICILLLFTCGCSKKTTSSPSSKKACEIAFITDEGTIEDGGFNEAAYEGMMKYSKEKNVPANYYVPADTDKASYLAEIKNAVNDGAKIIVTVGCLLEEAVYDASKQYPKVSFLLIDGIPHNSDYSDQTIRENVSVFTFAEEQAGFLAGYAAVRDGHKFVGYLGGIPEDSVIKYGYGFVQGADYAAIELGERIYLAYTYTDTFTENIHIKNMACNWYDNGCEVIFASGGNMNKSVVAAAEEKGKGVICSEYDKNDLHPSILVSCINDVSDAVYDGINSYYAGTFLGGQRKELTVKEDAIGLSMENSHFDNFSQVEYDAIYNTMKSGEIDPYDDTEIANTKELDLVNTTIVYAEYGAPTN